MEKTIHQGRNVKRFREMLGIKQEGLALDLGDDWSQRKISLLEQKEVIEPELLEQVAKVLKVPVEAIKNFDEEAAINNIACNFNDHASVNYKPVFNSMEKWLEALEEIKKLNASLIKEKDEKIVLLERLLQEKK
jgi:transcriptional regulator with XRE-family HTH domain